MTVDSPTLAETNKAIDQRFVHDVLNGRDFDLMIDLVAEDFVEQNPSPGQGPGREGLRQALTEMFAAFPDLRWTVHEWVAEGDRVAAWSTWSGTHRGEFLGIPATGRSVSVEAWTMDWIRDGKIAESRILMDVMGLVQQLGVAQR